jgi:hypothetical protein
MFAVKQFELQREDINSLNAGKIDPIVSSLSGGLMKGVDPTICTKIVLGGLCPKLIQA